MTLPWHEPIIQVSFINLFWMYLVTRFILATIISFIQVLLGMKSPDTRLANIETAILHVRNAIVKVKNEDKNE